MERIEIDLEFLKEAVDKWWDRWHRFAEENDEPPEYIFEIVVAICQQSDVYDGFNYERGTWDKK